MKKVLLFINSASRQGAAGIATAKAWLSEHQIEILNDVDGRSEELVAVVDRLGNEADAIVVGGGDGSVNHALPALIKTRLPLVIIPLGTANNLARTLAIPQTIPDALTLLLEGKITEIDVGTANEIPFVNVIGIGMSARVNRMVASESKRWFGVFAFAMTAVRVAARMTPFRVLIDCDGRIHHSRTWQVTVCNGRNYGNGLTISENATLNDRMLHGLSTEVAKWWHGFGLIPSLLAGQFRDNQHVTTFEGREVLITTRHSKHVDIDGDIKTRTPVRIAVIPRAIKIFVPSESKKTP